MAATRRVFLTVMVHLPSLCKPKAVRRYGFTNFQLPGGEPKRVDMNASRTRNSVAIYFELPDLRAATCACRKLNPGILVMQPAQNWTTKNVPGTFDSTKDWCILLQR